MLEKLELMRMACHQHMTWGLMDSMMDSMVDSMIYLSATQLLHCDIHLLLVHSYAPVIAPIPIHQQLIESYSQMILVHYPPQ